MKQQRTIQIVCADAELAREYLRELEGSGEPFEFRLAVSPAEARRNCRLVEPSVILLDESAAPTAGPRSTLERAAALLTEAGPVVVVAAADRQSDLAFLISSGAVDFVTRRGSFVSIAADSVERRIRLAEYAEASLGPSAVEPSGDFGEILRHEVNNPLTGILGNAELLLARRDSLPLTAIERVETIAELAVRLRETVRRLSHAWESREDPVRSV